MSDHTKAYPLNWPTGWKRHEGPRLGGSFKGTQGVVMNALLDEVNRLALGNKARTHTIEKTVIISTNMELRNDGLPYSNRRAPQDPGVAVYFKKAGQQMVFACDQYDAVWKNMQAIRKTIEALRGIGRWGSSEMMARTFSGFQGLPEPGKSSCWDVLGLNGTESPDTIKKRFRELARRHHPDVGGSTEFFSEINDAYQVAMKGGNDE